MVWEVKRGTGHAPPVVSGDYLVMIHAEGDKEVIECLQPETGKRHWRFEYPVKLGSNYGITDAPRSGPVIDGDLVYSKLQTGEFPDEDELVAVVGKRH